MPRRFEPVSTEDTFKNSSLDCNQQNNTLHPFVSTEDTFKNSSLGNPNIPNVIFPKKIGFDLKRVEKNGEYEYKVIINYKVSVEVEKVSQLQIGDIVVGVDQGETKNAVSRLVCVQVEDDSELIYGKKSDEPRAFKILETRQASAITKIGNYDDKIDQLNYNGLFTSQVTGELKQWVDDREQFFFSGAINSEFLRLVYNSYINRTKEINPLYSYNSSCLHLLKCIVNGKFEKKKFKPDLSDSVRNEIINWCEGIGSPLRLTSLSADSLTSLKNLSNVIQSFIDNTIGGKKLKTEEERKNADGVLYNYLLIVRNKITTKRKEKSKRIASFVIDFAKNARIIAGEMELPISGKNKSKYKNNRTNNWCSRSVGNILGSGGKQQRIESLYGITYKSVKSYATSHRIPFVYDSNKKNILRCRYNRVDKSRIDEFCLKTLKSMFLNKKESEISNAYKKGVQDLLTEYGITENFMKMNLNKFLTFLPEENILIPKHGGKYFMTECKLTTLADEIKYLGNIRYLSDSDEIAAINIAIEYIASTF